MASVLDAQLGFADESTYGTAVPVDRFFEFNSFTVKSDNARIESAGLRSGSRVLRSDRWVPNPKGAAGDVTMEVLDKSFGFFLKHMLGTVDVGAPADGLTPFTATVGNLNGKSFTAQVGRPGADGTVYPFTYEGGKVASWELSNDVDGLLMLSLSTDFAREVTTGSGAYALQATDYPTNAHLLSFVGGEITVGGVAVPVKNCSVRMDNGLKTDRHFIRGTGSKKEPLENAVRNIEYTLNVEFDGMTHVNRVKSATVAGALAEIVLRWEGPVAPGGTFPSLTVTLPAGRFDGDVPEVGGPGVIEHDLSGKALADPTNGAIEVVYNSVDTTP